MNLGLCQQTIQSFANEMRPVIGWNNNGDQRVIHLAFFIVKIGKKIWLEVKKWPCSRAVTDNIEFRIIFFCKLKNLQLILQFFRVFNQTFLIAISKFGFGK